MAWINVLASMRSGSESARSSGSRTSRGTPGRGPCARRSRRGGAYRRRRSRWRWAWGWRSSDGSPGRNGRNTRARRWVSRVDDRTGRQKTRRDVARKLSTIRFSAAGVPELKHDGCGLGGRRAGVVVGEEVHGNTGPFTVAQSKPSRTAGFSTSKIVTPYRLAILQHRRVPPRSTPYASTRETRFQCTCEPG